MLFTLHEILRGSFLITADALNAHTVTLEQLLSRDLRTDIKRPALMMQMHTDTENLSLSHSSESNGNPWASAPKGSVAVIPLSGTMLKNGTLCSYGTAEIANMMLSAASVKNIDGVVLDIDSGGGSADSIAPLVRAMNIIAAMGKPVVGHGDTVGSAAMWAMSATNYSFLDNTISSQAGSIGVMTRILQNKAAMERMGYSQTDVYSTLSTHKNKPSRDIDAGETDEEKYGYLIRTQLDPLAKAFQEQIKATRPKLDASAEGVLTGAMFFANDAVRVGLVDGIGDINTAVAKVKELKIVNDLTRK